MTVLFIKIVYADQLCLYMKIIIILLGSFPAVSRTFRVPHTDKSTKGRTEGHSKIAKKL